MPRSTWLHICELELATTELNPPTLWCQSLTDRICISWMEPTGHSCEEFLDCVDGGGKTYPIVGTPPSPWGLGHIKRKKKSNQAAALISLLPERWGCVWRGRPGRYLDSSVSKSRSTMDTAHWCPYLCMLGRLALAPESTSIQVLTTCPCLPSLWWF